MTQSSTPSGATQKQRKSSALLNYLDADHGILTRVTVAFVALICVFFITFSPVLSVDIAACAWRKRNFKLTLRRAAWYVKTGWPGWTYLDDKFFNVSEGMGPAQLKALLRYLDRRKSTLTPATYVSETLCALGGLIDRNAANGVNNLNDIARFSTCAEEYLELQAKSSVSPDGVSKDTRSEAATQDFNTEHALAALTDFADAVPLEKYNWFVVAGTFLGLFREQRFLPNDLDIDVGLQISESERPAFEALLIRSGKFEIQKTAFQEIVQIKNGSAFVRSLPVLFRLIHRTGVSLDVFYHHVEGDTFWHGSAIHRWENTRFKLKPYKMHGVDVQGPDDGPLYLYESYGKWERPEPGFDFNIHMPSLFWARNYSGVAHALKRLEVLATRNDTSRYNTILERLRHSGYLARHGN